MSETVIRVDRLGKQYRIGALQHSEARPSYKSLRDTIADVFSIPLRAGARVLGRGKPDGRVAAETFWALKDISFEVRRGDIVGVIGRNGAGKSTLLKVLSRITEPTTGHVELRGRIGSLLEVGTGFHPELTGRDNVFLNGAILGMKRADIARQFDEIVAFAEIDKFIDTPVKHYSSGMYLRLAFAVAAHLEPDILVVDEVLAVGDAQFQKKCLGKMKDVAGHGRTVLFVSHNTTAIQSLCSKAILLKQGRISSEGDVDEVLTGYLREQTAKTIDLRDRAIVNGRMGNGCARFTQVSLQNAAGVQISEVPFGVAFFICGRIENRTRGEFPLSVAFAIAKAGGDVIFASHHDDGCEPHAFISGALEWRASLTPNVLKPGLYTLYVGITDQEWNCCDYVPECMTFEVLPIMVSDATSRLDKRPGVILPPQVAWEVVEVREAQYA